MSFLDFVVLALATFYLAYVVTVTSGPFSIFYKLRQLAGQSRIFTCIYCFSVWAGAFWYVLYLTPLRVGVYPFALAGAVALAYRYTGGSHTT